MFTIALVNNEVWASHTCVSMGVHVASCLSSSNNIICTHFDPDGTYRSVPVS